MMRIIKVFLLLALSAVLSAPAFAAEDNAQWLVTKDKKLPANDAPIELNPNGRMRLALGPNTPPTTFKFKILPSTEALPGNFVELAWKNLIPQTIGCGPYFKYKSSKEYVYVNCETKLEIPNLAGWIEYQNKSKGVVKLYILK